MVDRKESHFENALNHYGNDPAVTSWVKLRRKAERRALRNALNVSHVATSYLDRHNPDASRAFVSDDEVAFRKLVSEIGTMNHMIVSTRLHGHDILIATGAHLAITENRMNRDALPWKDAAQGALLAHTYGQLVSGINEYLILSDMRLPIGANSGLEPEEMRVLQNGFEEKADRQADAVKNSLQMMRSMGLHVPSSEAIINAVGALPEMKQGQRSALRTLLTSENDVTREQLSRLTGNKTPGPSGPVG